MPRLPMSVFSMRGWRLASCAFCLASFPQRARVGFRARRAELQEIIPPPPEGTSTVGLAVATRVPGAAPPSAWVCVVHAEVTAAALGAGGGAGAGAGSGSLDEPLTEPHQRDRRLPLCGSLGPLPTAVVVQRSGFAASALRGGAAAGSALAIVFVRPPSVRTSVAKPRSRPCRRWQSRRCWQ